LNIGSAWRVVPRSLLHPDCSARGGLYSMPALNLEQLLRELVDTKLIGSYKACLKNVQRVVAAHAALYCAELILWTSRTGD
jgi:hypothetical protein